LSSWDNEVVLEGGRLILIISFEFPSSEQSNKTPVSPGITKAGDEELEMGESQVTLLVLK
jgi:hypothetical protein